MNSRSLLIKSFLFLFIGLLIASPTTVNAKHYSGYHYGYGHYYPYHRPYYRHHYKYKYHRGYHGHYGVSAHTSGNAAYVLLGVLGAAVLYHVFTHDRYDSKKYDKLPSYNKRTTAKSAIYKKQTKPVKKQSIEDYKYKEYEGWYWLAKGNSDHALNIFAVQSQQNLNSGKPKIGFALAAASNGEVDRANRAMRKAITINPDALNNIPLDDIDHKFNLIVDHFNDIEDNNDKSFMLATMLYIQKEYQAANELMRNSDQSESANNLRRLIQYYI